MKIHEYQAKALLARSGVAVPQGEAVHTAPDAARVAARFGGRVVVKAQIHAGGRGKGGGVALVADAGEAERVAGQMLGMTLVTAQTGPEGRLVSRLLVEETLDIAKELYLGIVLDRDHSCVSFLASTEGGMDIEEVAAKMPEKIHKVSIDPVTGIQPYHARNLAFGLGLRDKQVSSAQKFILAVYKAFTELDASLIEINPLVVTSAGEVMALDAKMNFDDNALFTQPAEDSKLLLWPQSTGPHDPQ